MAGPDLAEARLDRAAALPGEDPEGGGPAGGGGREHRHLDVGAAGRPIEPDDGADVADPAVERDHQGGEEDGAGGGEGDGRDPALAPGERLGEAGAEEGGGEGGRDRQEQPCAGAARP